MNFRKLALVATALAGGGLLAATEAARAQAQNTLTIVREVDSDRYDPHRSTARAATEALFMLADTLVSLDHDMTSIKAGLAESWTVSTDGKVYTFKLRQDVQFCDGKKMTADDVVYSLKRWIDPATRSPVRLARRSRSRTLSPQDPYTVEYQASQRRSRSCSISSPRASRWSSTRPMSKRSAPISVCAASTAPAPIAGATGSPRNDIRMKPPRRLSLGSADLREPWPGPYPRDRLAHRAGGEYEPRRRAHRPEPGRPSTCPIRGCAQIRANRNLQAWSRIEGGVLDLFHRLQGRQARRRAIRPCVKRHRHGGGPGSDLPRT
jgi:peptide/nickel transport system substrate-binding protein